MCVCVKHLNRCKTSTCFATRLSNNQIIKLNLFSFLLRNSCTARFLNNPINSAQFFAGGQCTTDSDCPTKTLSVRGGMESDQLHVRAIIFMYCMGRG